MRAAKVFFVVLLCALLWGCFESDTVVEVRPDGSGTIEETFMLSNAMLQSLKDFSKGFDEGETKDVKQPGPPQQETDPVAQMMKDARKQTNQYGPGVKFVSVVPHKSGEMTGYKATYSFPDITQLRITQNPADKVEKPGEAKAGATEKKEAILFGFVKGPVSALTVTMPPSKESGTDKKSDNKGENKDDPEAQKAMAALFKGMRVRMALRINGTVLKTNATYRDGVHITLFDLEFGKLIENIPELKKLEASDPKTIGDIKELAKTIKGLKVELENPVVVEFK